MSGTQKMPSDPPGFEFYFEGMAVGYFEESHAPSSPGRYHYMPYRGPGHYRMHEALGTGHRPRCFLRMPAHTIYFHVARCPGSHLLDLEDFTYATPRVWPRAIPLEQILSCAQSRELPGGWLYLPWDFRTWNSETPAYVVDADEMEELEPEADKRRYHSTIETPMVEDVVRSVYDHLGADSFAARLEALVYYVRHDAFLPRLGAPDPSGADHAQLRSDREFYGRLGAERSDIPCRATGCQRGAVSYSVFCRLHHFEQVRDRPCPFTD